jgi:uncharacterized protein (TIGR00255 family)
MVSMTGFAYREKTTQDLSVSAEIKGYNNRYLEVYVNLPPFLSVLENKIREKIISCCRRGKVEVFMRIREHNTPVNININKNAATACFNALTGIAKELGLKEKPNLAAFLKMDSLLAGTIFEIEKCRNDERYWQEIEPLLDDAVKAFCSEREREGQYTKNDIMSHIEAIETSLNKITSYAPVIEQTLKDNIRVRFAELLGNQIDENKVLAETASLLLKYTISEEISRLSSHLAEFRNESINNSSPGKKLDFLCQEINREINTIGSKSAIIEVSGEVVKMKETLENIREQLRNIE